MTMDPVARVVKQKTVKKKTAKKKTGQPKRVYDASGRQERAARTRDAIVDAAGQRFLRDGYAATTVAAVASDVGISDHTIYKAFGGKPGLLRAIRAQALQGQGPVPAEQRSDQITATEPDAGRIIDAWGALTAEVAPLVAPVLLLIREAAAADPEVGALGEELDTDRLRRMTDNARQLDAGGQLRTNMSAAEVADVLFTYSAPELYELLVIKRGWSPPRYGEFIAEALKNALL
jgi:AcrR family transcriptional regulator